MSLSLRFALPILPALPWLVSSCGTALAPASVPSPIVAAAPADPLVVTYREAANVFEILDNVSSWLPDKCDSEYRTYWQQRFGITPEDDQRFSAYKAIRERYYTFPADQEKDPLKSKNGLFAQRKPPDRVAEAFYGAATLEAAFEALGAFMKPEDVEALKRFYQGYRPRYAELLAESEAYPKIASALQTKLDGAGIADFYARAARFYGVAGAPRFTALYVFWPPVDHVTANNRGGFLILKYHPVAHREDAVRDIEIPVHELIHHISAEQPDEQKQALTRAFLARCDVTARLSGPRILEEPLAVAHQKMFLRMVDPSRFNFASSWYGDPWIGVFAKLSYGPVSQAHEKGGKLDGELMAVLGKTCSQIKAAAALLSGDGAPR
jgi:hypothetical protein